MKKTWPGSKNKQKLLTLPLSKSLNSPCWLFKALKPLESEFDLVIIDHGAGLGYATVAHLAATSTLLLVTNHEVTALSDGYALYKRAHMVNPTIRVGLVTRDFFAILGARTGLGRLFAPDEEEIAWSQKIIAAHAEAADAGQGVVVVEGKLIENLHVENAQRLIALKAAIDALAEDS